MFGGDGMVAYLCCCGAYSKQPQVVVAWSQRNPCQWHVLVRDRARAKQAYLCIADVILYDEAAQLGKPVPLLMKMRTSTGSAQERIL